MKSKLLLLLLLISITSFGQTASDYPFEVDKSGNGNRSLILIPGFASSGEVWAETKAIYKKEFTCYTLTMAGFADVEAQPNPSFVNWKDRIADYIKEKNIQKPILIGHSMGGSLAMALAADYPELVEKIIIVDALPFLSALNNPDSKQREKIDCSSIVNQITALSEEQFLQMQSASMPQLTQNTKMLATVLNWSIQSDRQTFAKMYCDFSNTDLREKIATIECPSLILLESYFKNFKPSIEEQYNRLESANLKYANKGLHFIMYDDKEWYFSQLANFLDKN